MKTVFLCTPHKLISLNYKLIDVIKSLGFNVLSAVTHSPQNVPKAQIFKTNVGLIRRSDVFVAVLKDYGKDLTFEVGMAYALNMPRIGIDYTAKETDLMTYYALDKIIKPNQLEKTLKDFLE